jgi:hypothetical protein
MAEGKGTVLTEKQAETLIELQNKESRTPKQEEMLLSLIAKRDAPPSLGDGCTSYLKEVYVYEKYGKEPIGGSERSKYTLKGKLVEDESIMMLSRIDSLAYVKNSQRFRNQYLQGEPDIMVSKNGIVTKIIDIKSSYDYTTLLANIGSPLNPLYKYQVQGYMALTGATEAEVCYCLVNMPQEIINSEKKRLFYATNSATEDNPEYLRQVAKLENNTSFDEIPIKERLLRFPIQRDEELIDKIYKRVEACREWLKEFDSLHSTLNS